MVFKQLHIMDITMREHILTHCVIFYTHMLSPKNIIHINNSNKY